MDPDSVPHSPLLIPFPQEKTTSLPCDLAQDLRGLEAQLRRQEGLERELMGTDQQVSPGLAASPPQGPSGLPVCSQLSPLSELPVGPTVLQGQDPRASCGTGQALHL